MWKPNALTFYATIWNLAFFMLLVAKCSGLVSIAWFWILAVFWGPVAILAGFVGFYIIATTCGRDR